MANSNNTRFTTIYALSDPETGEVRYVGKTVLSLNERLRRHLKDNGKNYRVYWIHSILAKGLRPVISVIEDGIGENWAGRERYWILYYREKGANLVNLTDGGDGCHGLIPSLETRAKIAAANRNRSPEILAKIAAATRNRSPEYRAKISAAKKGKPPPNKGKSPSAETCARMSAAHRRRRYGNPSQDQLKLDI